MTRTWWCFSLLILFAGVSQAQTATMTPTRTPSNTPTNTATHLPTDTPVGTLTPTKTATVNTPTRTPTVTRTTQPTSVPTATRTPVNTGTPTYTPSLTPTISFHPVVDSAQVDNATLLGDICASPPCEGHHVPCKKGGITAECTTYGGTAVVQVYALAHAGGQWQGTPIPVQTPIVCPGHAYFAENFDQCWMTILGVTPLPTPTGTPAAAVAVRVGGWIDRIAPPNAIWWR